MTIGFHPILPEISLSMKDLAIRAESGLSFQGITRVHDIAFGAVGESELVRLIRGTSDFVPELSIVAEALGEILGHVLFSKIELIEDGENQGALSLAPIAVLPGYQRQGIGSLLIRAGIERARTLGFRSILVLGDPSYYSQFGFTQKLTKNIRSRYAGEAYMGLELAKGSLSEIQDAKACYPKAFSVVD